LALLLLLSFILLLCPPHQYDVLEYHLGGPVAWEESGSTAPSRGNFYTALPSAVEHLFALTKEDRHRDFWGGPSSWVILLALGWLIACDFLWRKLGVRRAARGCGLLFLVIWPPFFQVSTDATNDLGAAFFFLVGVLTIIERGPGFLAGLALGMAAGCRFSIFTVGVAAMAPLVLMYARGSWRQLAWFVLGAAVAYLPWMVRAAATTGYPFFPLTVLPLGVHDPFTWSAVQAELYALHHHEAWPWQAAWWSRLPARLDEIGLIVLVPTVAAATLLAGLWASGSARREHKVAVVLFAGFLASVAAWNLLGTSPVRFLLPAMPLAVAPMLLAERWLCARERGKGNKTLKDGFALAIILLLFSIPPIVERLYSLDVTNAVAAAFRLAPPGRAEDQARFEEYFLQGWREAKLFETFEQIGNRPIRTRGPLPTRVFCLYEARVAAVPFPASTVTVHDALPPEWSSVELLRAAGFTHLLVNELELDRLRRFYPTEPMRQAIGVKNSPLREVPGEAAFYLDWSPWMMSVEIARRYEKLLPWDIEGPELLRALPALRSQALVSSGPLTPAGHRVFLVDLAAVPSPSAQP